MTDPMNTPFNISTSKESQFIKAIPLEKKERYYIDLLNLEGSWTGRADVQFTNTFFQEAIQLVINAIALFEKGYFDGAFYSLRQSLEISTTAIYISDDEDEKRDDQLNKWRAKARFAMQAEMINQLEKRNSIFADIKSKMKLYFDELDGVKKELNKYVHKQGFNSFYVVRNHPFNNKFKPEKLLEDFERYLVKCIGAIGVFRLAVDPFPVLLADENIYKRTDRFVTDPYSTNFISIYIGDQHIEEYKKTSLYQDYYSHFIDSEPMLESVVDLVKDQYINRAKIEEILSQAHLLGFHDTIALGFIISSNKISKIYMMGGWLFYFTELQTSRKATDFSSSDLSVLNDKAPIFNSRYDEAYLSCVIINGEEFYIEHNNEFNENETADILRVARELQNKYQELENRLNNLDI